MAQLQLHTCVVDKKHAAGCLAGGLQLVGSLAGHLVGWLAGWWLVGWLAGSIAID